MPHAAPFSVADHGPGMDTLHPGSIATKPQNRHRISPVERNHIPAGSEFLPFQTICQGNALYGGTQPRGFRHQGDFEQTGTKANKDDFRATIFTFGLP
jgi:hypothetical protein